MVDQKVYLGIFALLRDLETWRGIVAGYFCKREEIKRRSKVVPCSACWRETKTKGPGYNPAPARFMNNIFSRKVIRIVSQIPRRKTLTYKEVAKKAGNEKAARAVGNILNKYYKDCVPNKKKTVPCHRVIRSDGQIGGYAKGENEKRKLLKKEKAI